MARPTALVMQPARKSTFSWSTNSRAAFTASSGLSLSSRWMNSRGRPSTPPASLISFVAMARPSLYGKVNTVATPLYEVISPMRIGLPWAALRGTSTVSDSSRAATTIQATAIVRVMRMARLLGPVSTGPSGLFDWSGSGADSRLPPRGCQGASVDAVRRAHPPGDLQLLGHVALPGGAHHDLLDHRARRQRDAEEHGARDVLGLHHRLPPGRVGGQRAVV